jgi:hypothetical protein
MKSVKGRPQRLLAATALIGVLGLVVEACETAGESSRTEVGSVERDSAGVMIVESAEPQWSYETSWQLAPEPTVSIGGVDGPWEQQFSYVRDAMLLEGMVVVTEGSSGELRYYDLQGQHQVTIGRLGEGPGEFSSAASMRLCQLSGGSVAVTDDTRNRFHVISPEQEFSSTVSLPSVRGRPLWPRDCLSDGSWLVQGETHQRRDNQTTFVSHSIHVVDEGGHVTEDVTRVSGNATWWNPELEDNVALPFAAKDQALASGPDLVVLRATEGQIEWRTREGRLKRVARRVRFARVPTATEVDEQAFYDQGLPLPEFVPLYRAAFADPQGNVWAHRYRIPEETAGQYDVFDQDGAWLGTVEMPPDLTVFEIGSDHVVGMSRDSLDVQRVDIYGIVKGDRGR